MLLKNLISSLADCKISLDILLMCETLMIKILNTIVRYQTMIASFIIDKLSWVGDSYLCAKRIKYKLREGKT